MSRRHPRLRVRLTATVSIPGSTTVLVCPTRDISESGCYLDTAEPLGAGTQLQIAVLNHSQGVAIDMVGEVTRLGDRGMGVFLHDPPESWLQLVDGHSAHSGTIHIGNLSKRLRILVVGDDERRRGALALYVTSGWDVRFATDIDGAVEALRSVPLNAVIAEHELSGEKWRGPLDAAMREQPDARRILRCMVATNTSPDLAQFSGLVDRVVDAGAGMDALLDALTADIGGRPNVAE